MQHVLWKLRYLENVMHCHILSKTFITPELRDGTMIRQQSAQLKMRIEQNIASAVALLNHTHPS
jgi:hypothetical protein